MPCRRVEPIAGMRSWPAALCVAALLLCCADTVAAQQIRGTVLDATTGAPIADAVLLVVGTDSAITAFAMSDSAGGFMLRARVADSVRLRVQRLGYATVESVPLSLAAGDSLQLDIGLRPEPVELDPVVAAARPNVNFELQQFLRRQRGGFGIYYGPGDIAAVGRANANELLTRIGGARFMPDQTGLGVLAMASGSVCVPYVYVDRELIEELSGRTPEPSSGGRGGTPRPSPSQPGVPLSRFVTGADIRAIEVYRTFESAPVELQPSAEQRRVKGRCTIVAIWTERTLGLRQLR